jgi:hypothetical protein
VEHIKILLEFKYQMAQKSVPHFLVIFMCGQIYMTLPIDECEYFFINTPKVHTCAVRSSHNSNDDNNHLLGCDAM